jgi:hypothetical protein
MPWRSSADDGSVPTVPAFAVIGGGADGAAHVRRLLRAVDAGRLRTGRIVTVDHDPACRVAAVISSEGKTGRNGVRLSLDLADWSEWLDANLDALEPGAHVVPYHWAPHLLLGWLERQLQCAGARTARAAPLPSRGLPFEATTSRGDRALSYASWACPPTCIEPALCPHTRGARDWSLAADLDEREPADPWEESVVFRCLHLVWGVGTIPVDEIRAARDRLRAWKRDAPRTVLVATSSHCHALATPIIVS